MSSSRELFRNFMISAAVLGSFESARAAVIMNQIGSSPSFFAGKSADASQNFEPANSAFDTAVVDNFTVTGPTTLTNVSAALLGFGGFVSYSLVTGYEVAIYSSASAPGTSLTGNIYDHTFAPASVSVTAPYSSDAESALVSIPTTITIPAAGTYYLAVISNTPFTTNGEVGVYVSTGLTGSTPGDVNAFQANPGGGFGFTGGEQGVAADAAYSITGSAVPEPTTAITLGLACIAGLSRRRRQTL